MRGDAVLVGDAFTGELGIGGLDPDGDTGICGLTGDRVSVLVGRSEKAGNRKAGSGAAEVVGPPVIPEGALPVDIALPFVGFSFGIPPANSPPNPCVDVDDDELPFRTGADLSTVVTLFKPDLRKPVMPASSPLLPAEEGAGPLGAAVVWAGGGGGGAFPNAGAV